MIQYYVLDTETTGLQADFHEINEICIIRVSDNKQYSTNIKVKYPERASEQALEVQKRTKKDLEKGIDLQQAVKEINLFFKEDNQEPNARCIVAHNAPFDKKFCHNAWKSVNDEFLAELWLCTKQFAQRYVKKFGDESILMKQGEMKVKYGLNIFMEGIGIKPKTGAHSAIVDTQNTLELFNWLKKSNTEYVSLIKKEPQIKKIEDVIHEIYD